MNNIFAKVKGFRKKPYFKLISNQNLFTKVVINLNNCIPYNPDHNLDDDSWFKVEQFSQKQFCIEIFKNNFDSKDYLDLVKEQFSNISFIFSLQGNDFYFQKITPSLFIRKKAIVFGEVAAIEESYNRLVINSLPDAIYFKDEDTLIFKNLASITSIFIGIDELYKEATNDEVAQFLDEPFVELADDYNADEVSKPNRKRIALAMATLSKMKNPDKMKMHTYIESYCNKKLTFDRNSCKFKISTDDELKLLLYGIEQRFYTTPFGNERRLANSVVAFA